MEVKARMKLISFEYNEKVVFSYVVLDNQKKKERALERLYSLYKRKYMTKKIYTGTVDIVRIAPDKVTKRIYLHKDPSVCKFKRLQDIATKERLRGYIYMLEREYYVCALSYLEVTFNRINREKLLKNKVRGLKSALTRNKNKARKLRTQSNKTRYKKLLKNIKMNYDNLQKGLLLKLDDIPKYDTTRLNDKQMAFLEKKG